MSVSIETGNWTITVKNHKYELTFVYDRDQELSVYVQNKTTDTPEVGVRLTEEDTDTLLTTFREIQSR